MIKLCFFNLFQTKFITARLFNSKLLIFDVKNLKNAIIQSTCIGKVDNYLYLLQIKIKNNIKAKIKKEK